MGFKPNENTQSRLAQSRKPAFSMEQLIEDIFNEEYLLVVGNEVIMDMAEEESGDVNRYLLKAINKTLQTTYKDFNELASNVGAGYDPVRNLLNSPEDFTFEIGDMAPELRRLLETRLFPIVLTTTFDGYLELLLHSIWGDRLRVVNIEDKRTLDDFRNTLVEYRSGSRYREPTLVYLFGKATRDESKRYVRTDDDAIQIIEKWFTMPKDDPILSIIRNKKLLALGCKYDDWYFRFFWFILKREISRFKEGQVAFMINDQDPSDRKLKNFLDRSKIYCHRDARRFMTEISDFVSPSGTAGLFQDMVMKVRQPGGVFLSYCSKDILLAGQLFFQLKNAGFNVWFDNENLAGGDDYNREISRAISTARVFIPLLSPAVAADLAAGETDHWYNREWKMACQSEGKAFLPVAVDGYNLRASYHSEGFEAVAGHHTGIDLMERNGFARLTESINKKLMGLD